VKFQGVVGAPPPEPVSLSRDWVGAKIGRAEGQVERLIRLIENLLDVSRITAGRLELIPEEADLAAVVSDSVERLRDEAARSGSELRLVAPEPLLGLWDRVRMEQVVTNLLTNAMKYGSGKPIDVRAEPSANGGIRISVRDYGIGIPPHNQARIFERFERAVSERQYGGLGLGLWITRRIIEALEGDIRVVSAPGEGSIFTVELPRARPAGGR
jgi:signal transduction histidine kinase